MFIKVENISKTYKIFKREAGFKESIKKLFFRKYEYIKALDNISFSINRGDIVGYIGPNGSGKSSTIKILSGILVPDPNGICEIDGQVPWKNRKEYVKKIGVVFGQRSQLWWDIPVIDSFNLLKDIYSIDSATYRRNLEEFTTFLNISEFFKIPTRQLSLGQRIKCEIAASFLHSPEILFLDEPTIGLDAVSKLAVRSFILNLNKSRKATIILTTHDVHDIEALTSRIILVGKGKILLDSTLDKIEKKGTNMEETLVDLYKLYDI